MASIQIGVLGPVEAIVDSTAGGARSGQAAGGPRDARVERQSRVERRPADRGPVGRASCRRARPRWSSSTSRSSASCSATARSSRAAVLTNFSCAPDAVDAERFERRSPRPDADARAALRLWRGPALADVAEEPFAAAEITAPRRASDERSRGRHRGRPAARPSRARRSPSSRRCSLTTRCASASTLSACWPCTTAAARRMRSRRTARPATPSSSELGLEPGPELRELHEAILRHDPGSSAPAMVQALPQGTVSMLFTDIEGSTRLLQEHGPRFADMLAEHRRLLRTRRSVTAASSSAVRATPSSSPSRRPATRPPPPATPRRRLRRGPCRRAWGSTPASPRSTTAATWAST